MADTHRRELILALDQGTTSSRALLFDHAGQLLDSAQYPFEQIYPQPAWVEHDPMEILSTQTQALAAVLKSSRTQADRIAAIGITNQRETTVLWDRRTGLPIANAIVWQCRRTAELVEQICGDATVSAQVTAKTGLIPDAYFSASKIAWILDNTPGARQAAERGELAFGTMDSWLIYNLTGGKMHVTDVTNASRTMLFNIHDGCWDDWLLELFQIPTSLLPQVLPSVADFGVTALPALPPGIQIAGVAGDQQAALFGQRCFQAGEAKITFGTGAFLLMHTGDKPCASQNRLITTVAASAPAPTATSPTSMPVPSTPKLEYALEGSIFIAGALIQWLRDEMGLLSNAAESEQLALSVEDSGGVHVVPAFTGLGAPWWDADARGAILGLTRGSRREHVVRAALESLVFQSADLLAAFQDDTGLALEGLKVDGGVAANNFMMQFMADILGFPVSRPEVSEATGLGAAFLAGLGSGFWQDLSELNSLDLPARYYQPQPIDRAALLDGWHQALARVRSR